MNDIAQHTMDTIYYHKQKYAKLKHESLAKDDVITRLKQDIVDLQDKLKYHEKFSRVWSANDVLIQAEGSSTADIDIEEAQVIIEHIENNFDPSLGISWDTIEWVTEDYVDLRDRGELKGMDFVNERRSTREDCMEYEICN